LLDLGADVNATDENGIQSSHEACRIFDKRKTPYHNSNLKEFVRSLAVWTEDDGKEIVTMLRNAGADIDLPMYGGWFGPESILDSFPYDKNLDITEEPISLSSFGVSTRPHKA